MIRSFDEKPEKFIHCSREGTRDYFVSVGVFYYINRVISSGGILHFFDVFKLDLTILIANASLMLLLAAFHDKTHPVSFEIYYFKENLLRNIKFS